jgi:hypothetical protein
VLPPKGGGGLRHEPESIVATRCPGDLRGDSATWVETILATFTAD